MAIQRSQTEYAHTRAHVTPHCANTCCSTAQTPKEKHRMLQSRASQCQAREPTHPQDAYISIQAETARTPNRIPQKPEPLRNERHRQSRFTANQPRRRLDKPAGKTAAQHNENTTDTAAHARKAKQRPPPTMSCLTQQRQPEQLSRKTPTRQTHANTKLSEAAPRD